MCIISNSLPLISGDSNLLPLFGEAMNRFPFLDRFLAKVPSKSGLPKKVPDLFSQSSSSNALFLRTELLVWFT